VIGEVSYQVIVEELGAIVTIEPLKLKRQVSFDILDPFDNTVSAVVPCGAAFCPSGVYIGKCKAPNEVACHGVAAMCDGIGLHEAMLGDIPVVGAYGNLIA